MKFAFRKQSATRCLRFSILSDSEKLWNVFEVVLEKCEEFVQKSFSLKKYFERKKIRRHLFVVYVFTYPLSKFGGNRTNSLSFSSLQCLLQVKKLIRENSAKLACVAWRFFKQVERAVKAGNRDNKLQSCEEPGRETTSLRPREPRGFAARFHQTGKPNHHATQASTRYLRKMGNFYFWPRSKTAISLPILV